MADTTVKKVSSRFSPHGKMGQKYLVSGIALAMRLWENEAPGEKSEKNGSSKRDYETVGYVISGRAELDIEGQRIVLEPGDSWLVPKGVNHSYRILEPFTAVEATSPPSHLHNRDSE